MPRLVEDVLKKEVFTQKIPFVFSSATLSHQGDFSYIAKSLGIENVDSFSVASPFDYERQMQIFGSVNRDDKWDKMISSIIENNGGSLLLFSSREEMDEFRRFIHNRDIPFTILFEGDQEISEMVRRFQVDETAVLCSYHLWEGLDVPGKSLTQVIISSLPFPPNDPVFKAKRKHAKDPEKEVDLPYMLLRLRQGIGRLIRTSEDSGIVHIWMSEDEEQKYLQEVKAVLPVEIKF